MTSSTLHVGWEKLSRLPLDVVPCPRCNAPQRTDKYVILIAAPESEPEAVYDHWRWDEAEERWLCRRPSCMDPGIKQRVNPWMRMYPPVPR